MRSARFFAGQLSKKRIRIRPRIFAHSDVLFRPRCGASSQTKPAILSLKSGNSRRVCGGCPQLFSCPPRLDPILWITNCERRGRSFTHLGISAHPTGVEANHLCRGDSRSPLGKEHPRLSAVACWACAFCAVEFEAGFSHLRRVLLLCFFCVRTQ